MSNYDMTFDKKIADDKCFDTIFGGEEDNHLLDLVLKEDSDAFSKDVRDAESVEDGLGKIGAGDGLGDNAGPGHDENKPKEDTSDQDVLTKDGNELDKNDQLNTSDTAGGEAKDGGMVDTKDVRPSESELVGNDPIPCERHIDDNLDKVTDGVDKFEEAMNLLLSEECENCDKEDAKEEKKEDVKKEDAPVDPAAAEAPAEPAPSAVNAPPAVEEPAPAAEEISDEELLDIGSGEVSTATPASQPAVEPEEEAPYTVDDLENDVAAAEAAEVNVDDVKDKVDFSKVEDGLGKIGGGEGHGNDLGPDHDVNKPKDDSSDQEVLTKDDKELKQDQLNTSDEAGANKVEDGAGIDPKDALNVGEDRKAADDTFKEASVEDLEKASEAEEDAIIDAVKGNKEGGVSVSDLTADEDEEDEILNML